MTAPTSRKPVAKRGRPRKPKRSRPRASLSETVRRAVDYMVAHSANRAEAAQAVGISDNYLRQAFHVPEVMSYWNQQLQVLREGERARNIHTAIEIRDDSRLKDTAAGQKVRLEAAKQLEGDRDGGRPGVQVNLGISVTPGYVIDLDPGRPRPEHQIGQLVQSEAKPLKEQARVPHHTKEHAESGGE